MVHTRMCYYLIVNSKKKKPRIGNHVNNVARTQREKSSPAAMGVVPAFRLKHMRA